MASYLLVLWTRDGGLARVLPAADWTAWLWAAGLTVIALFLASAWYRFGRGVCAAASLGFVVAAASAAQNGNDRFAVPLLAVAFACAFAVGLATAIEDRVSRPT